MLAIIVGATMMIETYTRNFITMLRLYEMIVAHAWVIFVQDTKADPGHLHCLVSDDDIFVKNSASSSYIFSVFERRTGNKTT